MTYTTQLHPQKSTSGSKMATMTVLVLMMVALQSSTASAQWTTNGNNINNTNTGNVGIGTTAPTAKLHVSGSGNIFSILQSTSASAEFHLNSSAGGSSSWAMGTGWAGSGAIRNFYLYDNVAGAARLLINSSGNVGIGTTAPNFNLDVNRGSTSADVVLGIDANGSSTFGPMLYFRNSGTAISKIMSSRDLQFQNTSLVPLMYLQFNGNVGIGTISPANKLHVAGSITVDGNINAKYQDVAEWVPSSHTLPAGTVVTLDPTKSNHVEASSKAYDTRVAGVISAQPGIVLGERGENKVLVAATGRVKVKVDATRAAIRIGDLLVTGDTPGVAMKSEPITIGGRQMHSPGTLIGKALEPLEKGRGETLVLLSLQ